MILCCGCVVQKDGNEWGIATACTYHDSRAAEARAERYRKALEELVGILEIAAVMPDAIGKHALIAWNDPALERARAALRGEG